MEVEWPSLPGFLDFLLVDQCTRSEVSAPFSFKQTVPSKWSFFVDPLFLVKQTAGPRNHHLLKQDWCHWLFVQPRSLAEHWEVKHGVKQTWSFSGGFRVKQTWGPSGGFNKPPHGLRAIMGPGSEDGPMPGAVESDLFECTRRGGCNGLGGYRPSISVLQWPFFWWRH